MPQHKRKRAEVQTKKAPISINTLDNALLTQVLAFNPALRLNLVCKAFYKVLKHTNRPPSDKPGPQQKRKRTVSDGVQKKASIASLEDAELARVLCFLTVQERLHTMDLVCKAFYEAGKHQNCWDATTIAVRSNEQIPAVANYFGVGSDSPSLGRKHHYVRKLYLSARGLAHDSLSMLSRLTDLQELELSSSVLTQVGSSSSVTSLLSSLTQLKSVTAISDVYSLEFPTMPQLTSIHLQSKKNQTLWNVDYAHLPQLTTLEVGCPELHQPCDTLPPSLTELHLHVPVCTPQVLDNIAKLPNLQILDTSADVLSHLDIRFICSLTTLKLSRKLGHQARQNLGKMTNLTHLDVVGSMVSAADVKTIASLPSLTTIHTTPFRELQTMGLAAFSRARALKELHVFELTQSSLFFLARSTLTYLELRDSPFVTTLYPLSSCVNLTALHTDFRIREQDAQILSGLTKLEKLHITVTSEACVTHICSLPRLKVLKLYTHPWDAQCIGHAAVQALARLAPTIEKLHLPYVSDRLETIVVVTTFKKLWFFSTDFTITYAQSLYMRDQLPRLCKLYYHGHFEYRESPSVFSNRPSTKQFNLRICKG